MEPRYDNSYLDWIHKEGIEVRADQDLSAGLYDVQWQSIIARAST
jgi:methionine-rich copper-binding protein CopC